MEKEENISGLRMSELDFKMENLIKLVCCNN